MSRSLFLSAAVVLSATIAQSAPATSQPERIASLSVRFSDLDLHNDGDAQVLLARLERAAYAACGGNPRFHPSYTVMPEYTKRVFQKCRHDAIARAVATIGAPKLASAFAEATERTATARPHLAHSGDASGDAGT